MPLPKPLSSELKARLKRIGRSYSSPVVAKKPCLCQSNTAEDEPTTPQSSPSQEQVPAAFLQASYGVGTNSFDTGDGDSQASSYCEDRFGSQCSEVLSCPTDKTHFEFSVENDRLKTGDKVLCRINQEASLTEAIVNANKSCDVEKSVESLCSGTPDTVSIRKLDCLWNDVAFKDCDENTTNSSSQKNQVSENLDVCVSFNSDLSSGPICLHSKFDSKQNIWKTDTSSSSASDCTTKTQDCEAEVHLTGYDDGLPGRSENEIVTASIEDAVPVCDKVACSSKEGDEVRSAITVELKKDNIVPCSSNVGAKDEGLSFVELKSERTTLLSGINQKEEQMRKLSLVKMYRSKNNLTELQCLIDKWRTVTQDALQELVDIANDPKPSLTELIDFLQLDHKFIGFNSEDETFMPP